MGFIIGIKVKDFRKSLKSTPKELSTFGFVLRWESIKKLSD